MVRDLSGLSSGPPLPDRHWEILTSLFLPNENAMKKLVNTAMFILFTVVSAAVLAEIRTVMLSVPGIT